MTKPKRQHTVPAVYLRQFTDEKGLLTVRSKQRNITIKQSPDDASVRYHYYTQPENGISRANFNLEKGFFHSYETKFPKLREMLIASPPETNVKELIENLVILRVRSPAFREAFEIGLAEFVEQRLRDIPISDLPPAPKDFPNIRDQMVASIDPHRSIWAMGHYIEHYSKPCWQMDYKVVKTRRTQPFHTSDNPVIWCNSSNWKDVSMIYPEKISAASRLFFPIDKQHLLIGMPSKGLMPQISRLSDIVSADFVRNINRLIGLFAWDLYIGETEQPKKIWSTISRLYPRMIISKYDDISNEYNISKQYLAPLARKQKWKQITQ